VARKARPSGSGATIPQSPTRERRRVAISALVVLLAVAVAYGNSLAGPFVLDDQAAIVQNPRIRDLSRLSDVLNPAPDSPIAGRPLASLSLALNYAAGELDPRGYHVVNLALHMACALLVLVLVRRTVSRWNGAREDGIDASLVSFGAALLWGVHPLNSEVVNYLSQRTESLMAVCYLATVYAALRAAPGPLGQSSATRGDGPHPRAVDPSQRARLRWEAIAVAACLLGALSKESIATAPLVVVLFDRVFLFPSWRAQWAGRRRLYAGLACSWAIVGLLVATGARAAVAGLSSGVSPWTYLLNQAAIITTYLRLVVWPDALVAFYGWPQPVTVVAVLPHLAAIAALLALTGILLWRRPPLGFLGAWFFITLSPASSLIPVSTEVGAERRMYLPLVALAVLAALGVDALRRVVIARWQRASSAGRATAVALIAGSATALIVVTSARNEEYESPLALARTIVERRPTAVGHHMLAEELARAGQHDEALPHLRQAVAAGNSRARYLYAQVIASKGEYAEAIEQLEAFVRTYQPPEPLVPAWLEAPVAEVVPARFLLGRLYGLRGEWERSAEQGRTILALVDSHIGARRLLGDAAFARQQWSEAIEHYRAYLARQPDDVLALLNNGIAHVALERMDAAVSAFVRATELDPANARARELLALAREDRARLAAAGVR
jgi:tetratricopeptide (TPR) repeat protein